MRLDLMTWPECAVEIQRGTPLLLPVGSLEQHGPHLPLGTDTFVPEKLAERLGERRRLVTAPPILYATYSRPRSGGGRSFPGSVGIPTRTLEDTVLAVVDEFLRHGFESIAVLDGHYENHVPLVDAIERATLQRPGKVLLISWWELVDLDGLNDAFPGGFPGWGLEHASIIETSVMEALLPEYVRADLKVAGGAPRVPSYEIYPVPEDVVAPNGVLSTAEPASAELGDRIVGEVLDRMADILDSEFPPTGAGRNGDSCGTSERKPLQR